MTVLECGCHFDQKKRRWTFCEEAKRLHQIRMNSHKFSDREKYDQHFSKLNFKTIRQ